jgi:hypothetical protein
MALIPLFLYFAVENTLVWKALVYDATRLRRRQTNLEEQKKNECQMSYCLLGLTYLRDWLIAETVRQSPANLIYSPATQKLLTYLSIVILLVAIGSKFWSFKSIPLPEFFYPVYKRNTEPNWQRSLLHPVFLGSWALYLTAFLWQPSTAALYPLVFYPLLLQASLYVQENMETLSARFTPQKLPTKGV